MNFRWNRDRWCPTGGLAARRAVLAAGVLVGAALGGCNVDSFFNPSVVGYWEHTPTSIPILERIDVIEQDEDPWGQTTDPMPEDLVPNDLTYRIVPGDVARVSIYELLDAAQWAILERRVDAGGFLRVPELGEILAAGLTAQEFEDTLVEILKQDFMRRPQVDIALVARSAFNYTLYGAIAAPGIYGLINPDLRLLDGLATAGGLVPAIKNVFVIRQVELTEDVKPPFARDESREGRTPGDGPKGAPVDIEDLIEQLEDPAQGESGSRGEDGEGGAGRPGGGSGPMAGILRQDGELVVDMDDLPRADQPPTVDIDDLRSRPGVPVESEGTWIFLEELGEWVRMPSSRRSPPGPTAQPGAAPLYVERVIKIPAVRLIRGESRYNIVIRPKDRIFIEPPPQGVVYIDGFINRPGVFNLPSGGFTLSRLVAAAGGLGQLAIPERVDLVRMVGDSREAVVRLNLAAIRHRTEPDVLLKPNDHIIIGTSWIATPLAVIRNGFRATYGFGFLLDRNFGNDVFGAPPSNFNNR